jgi:hypothetical protein
MSTKNLQPLRERGEMALVVGCLAVIGGACLLMIVTSNFAQRCLHQSEAQAGRVALIVFGALVVLGLAAVTSLVMIAHRPVTEEQIAAVRVELTHRDDPRTSAFRRSAPDSVQGLMFGSKDWGCVTAVALALNDGGEVVAMATLVNDPDYGWGRDEIGGVWAEGMERRWVSTSKQGIGVALLQALATESARIAGQGRPIFPAYLPISAMLGCKALAAGIPIDFQDRTSMRYYNCC